MFEEGYYILFSVDLRTVTWGRLGPQIAYLKKLTNSETRNSFLKQQLALLFSDCHGSMISACNAFEKGFELCVQVATESYKLHSFKGALCSFGEDVLIRREISSVSSN